MKSVVSSPKSSPISTSTPLHPYTSSISPLRPHSPLPYFSASPFTSSSRHLLTSPLKLLILYISCVPAPPHSHTLHIHRISMKFSRVKTVLTYHKISFPFMTFFRPLCSDSTFRPQITLISAHMPPKAHPSPLFFCRSPTNPSTLPQTIPSFPSSLFPNAPGPQSGPLTQSRFYCPGPSCL